MVFQEKERKKGRKEGREKRAARGADDPFVSKKNIRVLYHVRDTSNGYRLPTSVYCLQSFVICVPNGVEKRLDISLYTNRPTANATATIVCSRKTLQLQLFKWDAMNYVKW